MRALNKSCYSAKWKSLCFITAEFMLDVQQPRFSAPTQKNNSIFLSLNQGQCRQQTLWFESFKFCFCSTRGQLFPSASFSLLLAYHQKTNNYTSQKYQISPSKKSNCSAPFFLHLTQLDSSLVNTSLQFPLAILISTSPAAWQPSLRQQQHPRPQQQRGATWVEAHPVLAGRVAAEKPTGSAFES